MNDARRKSLKALIVQLQELGSSLSDIKNEIETLKDEEQEYYDNMPPGPQAGEKGDKAQEAVSKMEDVINDIDNLDIDDLVGKLEEAAE